MKQLLKLLLLFLPLLVQAKDIPASPGTVQAAVNSAVAGDRIILSSTTYTDKFTLKPGVSLVGQGVGKTIFSHTGFEWYRGAIQLAEGATVNYNSSISEISFVGNKGSAWSALRITNVSTLKIFNCEFSDYFQAAIELVGGRNANQGVKNIEIYNITIRESSNEATAGCLGNISMYGYISDVIIRNSKIYHQSNYDKGQGRKSSGYGIKALPNYEGSTDIGGKLTRVRILNNELYGKASAPWANYTAPNISIEFWNVQTEECSIEGNLLTCSVSLEKENNPKPSVSVYVRNNTFSPVQGVSSTIELALSNAVVENNTFNYTGRTGIWGMFGEFNNGKTLTGIKVLNNTFNMGNISTSVFIYTSPLDGFLVQGNKWNGTGKPTLFEFRRANSNGSKNITIAGNSFPQGFNDFKYAEGAATQRPGNVVITDSPVVTPPVVQPPVVEPPVVTPPTTKTDTVYYQQTITVSKVDSIYATFDSNGLLQIKKTTKQSTVTTPWTITTKK